MARRAEEARRAAAVIGATYHCLDERDGFVVYDKPTLRKCYDLFRRVAPQLVFTHSADDYMMDHVVVSQLARSASFAYSAPNITTAPLREGSGVPHLYYCDPLEAIDPLGRPVEPTTLVDISRQLELKSKMLACHESQRAWLRAYHGWTNTSTPCGGMRQCAVSRRASRRPRRLCSIAGMPIRTMIY